MAINKIIYITIVLITITNGCHCKKQEPRPAEVEKNAFDYFPNNNDKQWVYAVYKTDYSVKPPITKYVYDDTLYFEKDSNILRDTSKPYYYKYYRFKKDHEYNNLLIGNFPDEAPVLRIGKFNIYGPLFDLDLIADGGSNVNYNYNGAPINELVKTQYSSPMQKGKTTALGNVDVINSNASYQYSTRDGSSSLRYTQYFSFAKNLGLVESSFDYNYKNSFLNIDSSYSVLYKIKKVIN